MKVFVNMKVFARINAQNGAFIYVFSTTLTGVESFLVSSDI